MKKIAVIVVTVTLALGVFLSGDSYAGNEGWAAAGGFLGGLVVGSALNSRPYYYTYSTPVYYYSGYYPVYTYPVYSTYGSRTYYYGPGCYSSYTVYSGPGYYYDYWY